MNLVADGVEDEFDTAIVLSGDGDMCPAVRTLQRLRPDKRVIAVFPPKRHSEQLRRVVTASFTLGEGVLRSSQLPEEVVDGDGRTYRRPPTWR